MARNLAVNVRIQAEDAASGTVTRVEKSFSSLRTGVLAFASVASGALTAAFVGLKSVMDRAVDSAAESEEAVASLEAALARLGPSALASSRDLQAQAAALQATTRFSDDAIIKAQALLATYGVQADRLGVATQATVDLAAAMGTDLNSAAAKVGGTMSGFTRGVDKVVPSLKGMTEESLRAGAGIDAIAAAMSGRAVAAADTYAGALARVANATDELFEKLGGATVESEALRRENAALADTLIVLSREVGRAGGLWEQLNVVWTRVKATAVAITAEALNMAGGLRESAAATTEAAVASEALVRSVTTLAQIQDRETRILSENATARSRAAQIARELGVTLESEVNAKLEAERLLWEELNKILRQTGDQIVVTTDAQNTLGESATALNETTAEGVRLRRQHVEVLRAEAQALAFTSRAYYELARAQGRAAATQAAVAAGGRVILGGTRVLLPGGGSRLTSEPGFNGGRFV